jgi:sulfur carrier protein ThiS
MRLHLGGHLNWYAPHRQASLVMDLAQPTALAEILKQLNVPAGEVAITVINGRVADLQAAFVSDSDRVEVYPPIGGGGSTCAATSCRQCNEASVNSLP